MLSRLTDFPWTRLSHSESGKAGHPGVLMILTLTRFGFADLAWSSGHNFDPISLFWMIQGRLDSSTFFYFLITLPD